MSIEYEWEGPYFKLLSKNDSGEAKGHQSGVVIPKEFDPYLPDVTDTLLNTYTPDREIEAILMLDGHFVGRVITRYQYQTWSGTRSPERRITGQLSQIISPSKKDDLFLIERNISNENLFRLSVFRSNTPEYQHFTSGIGTSRWGLIGGANPFIKSKDVSNSIQQIESSIVKPFNIFDVDAGLNTTVTTQVARSRAFQRIVKQQYPRCAFCGGGLRSTLGQSELEAAHVVSRKFLGTDDPRNGLSLCKAHHWAFDAGLVSISETKSILISPYAKVADNKALIDLGGKPVASPIDPTHALHPEAVAWHRDKVFMQT